MNKIVLFHPAYAGPPLGAPLSLLSLAAPLLEDGFRVSIVDGAIEPDVAGALAREIPDALCLGVSLLTGPMIRTALEASRLARRLRPDLPVVFGGWHPSLLPDQTLDHELVDIVVRGQGERSMRETARRLRAGEPLDGVDGISFKSGGRAVHNAGRAAESINLLPPPAYALANFDAYERAGGVRKLPYASSLGCPYACHYCTDQVFYERRFNAYPAARVVAEVTELVSRHHLREVALLDSNFLVNGKRAVEIAHGFIAAKSRFHWTFQASTDLLCRLSDGDVGLLGESGVTHMGFGTESASEAVLALMNKRHQRVDEMYETARKTEQAGIRVTFNIIVGYPGETEADRRQTFRVMSDIARRHANVSFSPNIFTPYPGIPIWPQLKALGVPEPSSLEAWAGVDLGSNRLPWLQGRELRRLRRMLEYFLLNNQIRKTTARLPWARNRVRRALGAPLRWRLNHHRYAFPLELWVARLTESLVTRRSLVTGQALARKVHEVC